MALLVNNASVGSYSSFAVATIPVAGTTHYSSLIDEISVKSSYWNQIFGQQLYDVSSTVPTFTRFCDGASRTATTLSISSTSCRIYWALGYTPPINYTKGSLPIEYASTNPAYAASLYAAIKTVPRGSSDLVPSAVRQYTNLSSISTISEQVFSLTWAIAPFVWAQFDCLLTEIHSTGAITDSCYLSIFQKVNCATYHGYESPSYDIKALGYV